MSVSLDDFKAVMGSFAASVTVVTTVDDDGVPHALTATAFSSLSKDPPLCLVCVDLGARPHGPMSDARKFAVNILGSEQAELSTRFASRVDDKFSGVGWTAGVATGCPILPEVLAWAECEVTKIVRGGDHDIFIGRIIESHAGEGAPLVYWRGAYHKLTR